MHGEAVTLGACATCSYRPTPPHHFARSVTRALPPSSGNPTPRRKKHKILGESGLSASQYYGLMIRMAATNKGGRPSKGPRKPIFVRMPLDLAAELEAEAKRSGQDVTTWVTELIADRLRYPLDRQERLPLNAA